MKYTNLAYVISENISLQKALKIDPRELILLRKQLYSYIKLFQSDSGQY